MKNKTIKWTIGNRKISKKVTDHLVQIYPTKNNTFIFQLDWDDLPVWVHEWIVQNKKKINPNGTIKGWIGTDQDGQKYEVGIMAGSLMKYVTKW